MSFRDPRKKKRASINYTNELFLEEEFLFEDLEIPDEILGLVDLGDMNPERVVRLLNGTDNRQNYAKTFHNSRLPGGRSLRRAMRYRDRLRESGLDEKKYSVSIMIGRDRRYHTVKISRRSTTKPKTTNPRTIC